MSYPVVTFPDGTTCRSGPNCQRHGDKHTFFNQVAKHAVDQVKANPLALKTPVDVDTQLADVYNRYYKALAPIVEAQTRLKATKKRLDPNSYGYNARYVDSATRDVAYFERKIQEARDAANLVMEEAKPFEEEYTRRGGWTRAFLVDNAGGHVHKSMHCSTCYPTTRFTWLPSYSGGTENTIVDDAGEKACTECYPSAPVETLNRPSRIESPERAAARIAKEKAKAEKDRIAAEKGITNVDGTPLKPKQYYGVVKTARTAEIEAVSSAVSMLAFENGYYPNESSYRDYKADYRMLLEALAHKKGTTIEAEDAYLKDKAAKKFRKEYQR